MVREEKKGLLDPGKVGICAEQQKIHDGTLPRNRILGNDTELEKHDHEFIRRVNSGNTKEMQGTDSETRSVSKATGNHDWDILVHNSISNAGPLALQGVADTEEESPAANNIL